MRIEWLRKIKEKVTKQLKVGFIKLVHQAKWIANVVPAYTQEGWKGKDVCGLQRLKEGLSQG